MLSGISLILPSGSSHHGWIVQLAWMNLFIMGFIMSFVFGSLCASSYGHSFRPKRLCNKRLEWWWSFIPIIIIIILDVPNLVINYVSEKNPYPVFGAKVVGLQWYWQYELEYLRELQMGVWEALCSMMIFSISRWTIMLNQLSGFSSGEKNFFKMVHDSWSVDSYETPWDHKSMRFGRTDTRLVLPSQTPCRLLCTGADVIHNFNLKTLGVSVDCVPGRVNQHKLLGEAGLYQGLCSELCGINHPHMPCSLEMIPFSSYVLWLQGN